MYSALANGAGSANVVVPAASGIAHVLDHLSVKIGSYGAATAAIASIIQLLDGAAVVWQTILSIPAGIATDSVDIDLPVSGAAGNSMSVTSSAALGASLFVSVTAIGHDV